MAGLKQRPTPAKMWLCSPTFHTGRVVWVSVEVHKTKKCIVQQSKREYSAPKRWIINKRISVFGNKRGAWTNFMRKGQCNLLWPIYVFVYYTWSPRQNLSTWCPQCDLPFRDQIRYYSWPRLSTPPLFADLGSSGQGFSNDYLTVALFTSRKFLEKLESPSASICLVKRRNLNVLDLIFISLNFLFETTLGP